VAGKKWSDLSTGQKRGIVLSGAMQIGLLIAALVDIHRRPTGEIRAASGRGPPPRSSTSPVPYPTSRSDAEGNDDQGVKEGERRGSGSGRRSGRRARFSCWAGRPQMGQRVSHGDRPGPRPRGSGGPHRCEAGLRDALPQRAVSGRDNGCAESPVPGGGGDGLGHLPRHRFPRQLQSIQHLLTDGLDRHAAESDLRKGNVPLAIWNVLIARRLFRLGRDVSEEVKLRRS
jgi:hypothetical protein